jgi:DNA topoisomerase I
MPKKQKISKEEKHAGDFFRVDKSDLAYSIEKQVKEKIPKDEIIKYETKKIKEEYGLGEEEAKETVEKVYKKPSSYETEKIEKKGTKKKTSRKKSTRKKTTKKKTAKKTTKKEYKIPNIKLKKEGYELIITEKPQAASKISNSLGKAVQKNLNKVPYYEIERNGKQIRVACAVGHLFTLSQNSTGSKVPVFDISWVPNYMVRKKDFTKRYYDAILKLVKEASEITVATDYDIEGEVIGWNVVRFLCNQKDAERMKFSTLTPKELNDSYESKFKHIDWGHAIAGETRHYLDWFYGINLSRALMNAIKTTGRFKLMSIGRVQGPSLNLIVKKEKEIQAFEPRPYWNIFIKIDDGLKGIFLKHNKDIFDKNLLKNFESLKGKTADVSTTKKEQKIPPNTPFNLTTLQTEAYKFYGITPARTLQVAQSLYLNGLISYPRTSSQKLPASIGYKQILEKLAREFKAEHLIKRDKPIEGKKSDPAHPSIYPTGETQILSGEEDKIYKLIVKRFLSLFCEDAIVENKKIEAIVDKLKFNTHGKVIKKKAWMEIYPSKLKEEKVPDINGEKEILDVTSEEKETQPPKRYSPASIVSELEKRNLGTKATRSNIIETLYDRGYIEGQSIRATALGISLIDTLEKYSPIITDEALTKEFEDDMEEIQGLNKKQEQIKKEEKIIESAKTTITKIIGDFEKHKEKVGKELLDANVKFREKQKIENQIMTCPKCKKGHLAITYSKKTKRFFVACDAYPDCQNTFPLPPNGTIKKTDKVCEECGWPMLMRLKKGRKPWIFCFNPDCPTNESWAKNYKDNKEKSSEKKDNTVE